jgi:hypothetical protein
MRSRLCIQRIHPRHPSAINPTAEPRRSAFGTLADLPVAQIAHLSKSPWPPVFRCNAKHYAPISNYLVKVEMDVKTQRFNVDALLIAEQLHLPRYMGTFDEREIKVR